MLWVTKFSTLPGDSADHFKRVSLRGCSLCCFWMAVCPLWVVSTHMHTHTCTHADQHSSQPLRTLCGCLLSHSLALNASSLGLADVCSAFSLLAPAGLYLGPSPCSVAWKLSPDSKIGHTWVPPPSSRGSLSCAAQSSMSETGFCAFCPGFSCFKWEANFSPFLVRSRGTPGVFFTVFPFSSCLPWLPHRLRLIPGWVEGEASGVKGWGSSPGHSCNPARAPSDSPSCLVGALAAVSLARSSLTWRACLSLSAASNFP